MRVFQPKFVPVEYEELIIHRIEEEFYQSDCFHACFTLWQKNDILSSGRSGWCVPKGRPYYISSDIEQICLYRQLPNRRLSNRKRCNCRRIRKSIRSLRLWDRVPDASWTASNHWCLPIASTGSITPISSLLSFANESFVPIYNIRQLIAIRVIKPFASGI